MMRVSIVTLLVACGSGEPCEDCAETGDTEDTAAMVYSTGDPEPLWNADEVGEQLSAFMAVGAPNPRDICDVFSNIMALGDDDCPGDPYNLSTVPAGCDTDDGFHYAGIGWYYASDWLSLEDGGQVDLSYSHGGDFEIFYPSGLRFAGGGGMSYMSEQEDGELKITSDFEVHGSWIDESRQDWLAAGFSGVYEATVTNYGDGDYGFTATGGIGLGSSHIFLDEATWDTTDACAGALSGAIHLRDARGFWTVWDLGDDCDTCGTVTFHEDDDLGELCLDTTEWGHLLFILSTPR